MIILNQSGYTLAPIGGRVHFPRPTLTLVVKGVFHLRPGDVVEKVDEDEYPTGDLYFDDDEDQQGAPRYESDHAYFKPRADLLLAGTCYPPKAPAGSCEVTFRVGTHERTLKVFGERFWKKGLLSAKISRPEPFSALPLRYEQAFGGEGYPANPSGLGLRAVMTPDGKQHPLPRIEDPRHLITAPSQRPPPAGFGPLHRLWKPRGEMLGTYKGKWQQERWPWFPEDLDWAHFNAAPPEMQVEGYLRGDEEVELRNLHPEHARLLTRLPSRRARAFVQRVVAPDHPASFEEIELHLDTLFVDADASKLVLLWRGVHPVASDELDDVTHLFLAEEPLEATTPEAAFRAQFDALLRKLDEPDEETPDDALGEGAAEQPPEADAAIDADEEALDASMVALEKSLRAAGDDPDKALAALQASAAGRAFLDDLEAEEREGDAPESEASAEAGPWTRERVMAAAAARKSLRGEDLAGLDLSGLDLAGMDLTRARLQACSLQGTNLQGAVLTSAHLEHADLGGAMLEGAVAGGAHAEGARLGKAHLDGSDWTAASLPRVDLREASLADAVFQEANLEEALLARCQAPDADFSKARMERVTAEEADLHGARLEGALLTGADFSRANLAEAHLDACQAKEACFVEANLTRVRASEGARFDAASFRCCQAPGASFDTACMPGADFLGAHLEGADFSRALLEGAQFYAAHLRGARFRKARMRRASLGSVDLFEGSLEKADLRDADLRGSNLYGVELFDARLEGARLDGANLGKTLRAQR